MTRPRWHEVAACLDSNPSVFFAVTNPAAVTIAKRVCARCPVLDDCRRWAVTDAPDYCGIAGGLTPAERVPLTRAWRRSLAIGASLTRPHSGTSEAVS